MMKMTRKRFEESDYSLIYGNKMLIDVESDYVEPGTRVDLD